MKFTGNPIELTKNNKLLQALKSVATVKQAKHGRVTLTTLFEGYEFYIHPNGVVTDNFSGVTETPSTMTLDINGDNLEIEFN